jgi:hypothetical protein
MSGNLTQIEPPALPLGTEQYQRPYQDQLNNVHRLFYNRLTNIVNAVLGSNGGQYIDCPNGLFFNTADQTLAVINTAYPVVFNTTYLNNAVNVVSSSRITVTVGGVYNLQYTGQILTTSASSKTLYLWVRRNGTNIGFSTRAYTLDVNNSLSEITFAFNIDLDADEYVELVVSKDALGIQLEAQTASAPHPGIPSSVLSVNFIAPLPVPRPTPP